MIDIGRIISYGTSPIPDKWQSGMYDETARLCYIHSGKGGFTQNGKYTELTPGHLYLFPSLSAAEPYNDPSDKIVYTYSSFELIPPIISSEVLKLDPEGDPEAMCALQVFLTGGRTEDCGGTGASARESAHTDDFLTLCKMSIAYLTSRIISASSIRKINDRIIISALKIMHSALSENITVESLAKKYYITPDAFIRKFRSEVGITPYSYLKKLRIRTAYLLKESGESLEKIAKATGYSDPSSLLHAMKSLK